MASPYVQRCCCFSGSRKAWSRWASAVIPGRARARLRCLGPAGERAGEDERRRRPGRPPRSEWRHRGFCGSFNWDLPSLQSTVGLPGSRFRRVPAGRLPAARGTAGFRGDCMQKLVECVPNFSEGRDRGILDAIAASIREVEGVRLLDVDPGAATNRTVFTMVGPPEPVMEAAFRAVARAAELIDMSKHQGEHPRMGATDVCPFVPVSGRDHGRVRRHGPPGGRADRPGARDPGLPLRPGGVAARARLPGQHPRRRVRGPGREAEEPGVEARLRPRRLQPADRAPPWSARASSSSPTT